jgi:hypothetical protein
MRGTNPVDQSVRNSRRELRDFGVRTADGRQGRLRVDGGP